MAAVRLARNQVDYTALRANEALNSFQLSLGAKAGLRHVKRIRQTSSRRLPNTLARTNRSRHPRGGALGACQGGVSQALHEAGVETDRIIGTSIGAINACLIARNRFSDRLVKLEQFWKRMERRGASRFLTAWPELADIWALWPTLIDGIPGFFKPNPHAVWAANLPLGVSHAAFYSTDALRETLTQLVDFSIINSGSPRLTVGAANVESSTMQYFDSRETPITTEQIMASGALPPAFPAIKIDDQFF